MAEIVDDSILTDKKKEVEGLQWHWVEVGEGNMIISGGENIYPILHS